MDTDNEADVVAAPRAGLAGLGDAEVPDRNSETARSRDAVTRKIRNPLSGNRQSAPPPRTPAEGLPVPQDALPPKTPTPTPVLPPRILTPTPRTPAPALAQPRVSTPSPGAPTPTPVLNKPRAATPAPKPIESPPAAAPPPSTGRLLEHSGNIHVFPLFEAGALGQVPAAAKAKQKHKGLMVIAAVMVCGVLGNVALWRRSSARVQPAEAVSLPAQGRDSPLSAREAPPVPASLPPTIAPLPEPCHLEITVQEPDAKLVLDGQVATGNQIKLDVPKDDELHLVEASAPGFLPFKRSISFSQDVFLNIALQKPRAPSKRDVTVGVKPEGKHADDQGMSSRSSAKRPASQIDEDDPYAP